MGIFDKFLKPNVDKLKENQDIEGLIKLLDYNNRDTRIRALVSLVEIRDRKAISALSRLLQDTDKELRWLAAWALGAFGSEASNAIPALVEALKDESEIVQWRVAEALAEIGETAVPSLADLLKDKNPEIRKKATETLGRFGSIAKAAVPPLIKALRDKNPEIRKEVAKTLGEIGPDAKEAISKLTQRVEDKDKSVGIWVNYALAKIKGKPKAHMGPLIEALKNGDLVHDALEAVTYLGSGAKSAVPLLIKLLKNKDEQVRWHTADALGEIGPDAKVAVPALIELLKPSKKAQLIWVWMLEEIHSNTKLKNLSPACKDVVLEVLVEMLMDRRNAISALGKIGDESTLPTLIEALKNEEICGNAASAIGCMGPAAKDAVPVLIGVFKHQKSEVRVEIVKALGRIGSAAKAAIPILREALEGKDKALATFSLLALAGITGEIEEHLPELIKALEKPDEDVTDFAKKILWDVKDDKLHKELEKDLKIQDKNTTQKRVEGDIVMADGTRLYYTGGVQARELQKILFSIYLESKTVRQITNIFFKGILPEITKVDIPILIGLLKHRNSWIRWKTAETIGKFRSDAKGAVSALVELLKEWKKMGHIYELRMEMRQFPTPYEIS